jgi:glutathione S-transferase
MIVLCGFSVSNYYNKVKLALMEKNVPFTEEVVKTMSKDPAVLSASPLGKIPYIRTPHGPLSESQTILNYLELAYPNPPLLPADAFAAAKVHELTTYIDLHLELVARELYGKAFFGGEISEGNAARVRKQLEKNIAAFKTLAKFSPFVAGDTFTQADCAAWVSLPLVAMASKTVCGEDLLAAAGVDWRAYGKVIAERPSAQRVTADKKADAAKMAEAAAAAKA